MKSIVPSLPEIGREAAIVILGAIVAAYLIGKMPQVRDYISAQWGNTPRPF